MKLIRKENARRSLVMTDNIIYLHGKPTEIAQTTRVGFREQRLCEQLLSANKLSSRRFVLDAGTDGTRRQQSLMRSIKERQAAIILETNCAEVNVPCRFSGSIKFDPWADQKG